MRVRWALEEVGRLYAVRLVTFTEMKQPAHRARYPFGQIATYEEGDLVLSESSIVAIPPYRHTAIPPYRPTDHPKEQSMSKKIFISLPVADLQASTTFYKALGFEQNAQFSDDTAACMAWSESIQVMLLTHAKWRTFTQRPFPPAGTSGLMLSLALDSRGAVDAINRAAAAHGGQADANPAEDFGFMYSRDLADPDGHLWAAFWMDPAARPASA